MLSKCSTTEPPPQFPFPLFETGSHYVAQAGLKFTNPLASASLALYYRCALPHLLLFMHHTHVRCIFLFGCLLNLILSSYRDINNPYYFYLFIYFGITGV
jgi:hypothetical protein